MRGFKPNVERCIGLADDGVSGCTELAVCACGDHNGEPLCETHAEEEHAWVLQIDMCESVDRVLRWIFLGAYPA